MHILRNKGYSSGSHGKGWYHPYERMTKGWTGNLPTSRIDQHGSILARYTIRKPEANLPTIPHDQPRASSPTNDNYCVDSYRKDCSPGANYQHQDNQDTKLNLGAGPKVVQILRGLHPPLSDPAKLDMVTKRHKL